MNDQARRLLLTGAVLMALATMAGAFGAHSLKSVLSPEKLETFRTAVYYQFFSTLGLLAIGLIADRHPGRMIHIAGTLMLVGIVLFSGSLYLLVAGAPTLLGVVTPLGGLCLIGGWLCAALAIARSPMSTQ